MLEEESAPNRRRSPRRRLLLEASVRTPQGECFLVQTVDVSPEGLCLAGYGVPLQVGDEARIALELPAPADGLLVGIVRWRSAERIGVELVGGARAALRALTELCASPDDDA